jgi:hypothetical protein
MTATAIMVIIMGSMAAMGITVTTTGGAAAVVHPPGKSSPTQAARGQSRKEMYNRSHGKGNADHPVAAGPTDA